MAAEKLRVAVVGGAGQWGRRYLHAYVQNPECEVIALVDTARERRDAFAVHYGVGTTCDTVEELLSREVPDIVSAVVPVAANPGAVSACAEAGVRVVSCEKPIAVELSQSDEMLRICGERGTVFSCGSVYSGWARLSETVDWLRQGHLGRLTGAALPGGLGQEASGGGCAILTLLRLLSGAEVEWVEGWTRPPDAGYSGPCGAGPDELDGAAWGRLGLSGGIVCDILEPGKCSYGGVALTGEQGQLWMSGARSVFVRGRGPESTPVFPDFLDTPLPSDYFALRIERLLRAHSTGRDELDNGRGYQQALEIAIALKLSAPRGHERIRLPLEDRSLRLYPWPYRLQGGDVVGWEGDGSPPRIS